MKALVAETMERFGKIDILVNNAALFAPLQETKCTEIDTAVWDRVMAINLRGPFLMVKHVAPQMSARGYGKIINIGSGSIFHGIPWMLHYVTSKGGIMAMTRVHGAGARRARHPGQHAVAWAHHERDAGRRESGPRRHRARPRRGLALAQARRSIRRICSARSSSSPAPTATS